MPTACEPPGQDTVRAKQKAEDSAQVGAQHSEARRKLNKQTSKAKEKVTAVLANIPHAEKISLKPYKFESTYACVERRDVAPVHTMQNYCRVSSAEHGHSTLAALLDRKLILQRLDVVVQGRDQERRASSLHCACKNAGNDRQ